MISAIIAAVVSFTATATGVEKGTPLEFLFAGKDTDRDYETMFLLDEPVDSFLARVESAGFPRGNPTEYASCQLWPVGAVVTIEPKIDKFVERELPEGFKIAPFVYTGGTRLAGGLPDAATNMPAAVFSLYSLAQSPFVYNGIYEQGAVYGSQKANVTLKKGEKFTFTIKCEPGTKPQQLDLVFNATNLVSNLKLLKDASQKNEISVKVGYDDDLTVSAAVAVANALSTLDSVNIKINGRFTGDLFYRAFLPLVKWRSRQERLTQPFEIYLGKDKNRVLFIEEDWSVEGDDPKLTEKEISFAEMSTYTKTDTAFFFVSKTTPVGVIKDAIRKLPKSVVNHYVYGD